MIQPADHLEVPVIRVFLVDDHEVVRQGLKRMLAPFRDIAVVGEAGTGEQALNDIPSLLPDVVLLDLRLPRTQGLDVMAALHQSTLSPKVLVLTIHDDEDIVLSTVRAGACGYVLKTASCDELMAAIRAVATGGYYFSEDVMFTLAQGDRPGDQKTLLTERERDVLSLLTTGVSNKEIGKQLYLSPDTVKTHLGSIYRKLGVRGRAEAVAVTLRKSLLR